MLNLKVTESFLDRPKILKEVEAANKTNLSQAGKLVRAIARNSIKTRRQKVKSLSLEEKKKFRLKVKIAKFYGRPRPLLPRLPSKPGDPPNSVSGLLKRFIFFSWDSVQKTAPVGPSIIPKFGNGTIPNVLEYGGRSTDGKMVLARPFMRPAEETARRQYPKFWKDSI